MSFSVPGYIVYERLGVGARSSIWLVSDRKTGQHYALKRVLRRATEDTRFLVQAQNDFDISNKFESPFLRKSFSLHRLRKLFQVKEIHVIMEYVDGRTLEDIGPLGMHGMLGLFIKVASGLEALHDLGYVHADIKPNNILVGKQGEVKIIDFGQSCPIGHVKGRIQGTPDYIAPEQTQKGIPLTPRTDVFNFGATIYWAVTGKTYPTVLASNRRAGVDLMGPREAAPPEEINSNVPTALSRLIMECCAQNPKDRPSDMREVRYRLEVTQHILDKNGATLTGAVTRSRSRDRAMSTSSGDSTAA